MRRPTPLKRTGLKAADFKLIGEIVVLSGMIEDTLKRMPLAMLRVAEVPGIAMTTHLKASSLCDIVLAITPYFVQWDDLTTEVEEAIKLVRKASDVRNDIVHGPFCFKPETPFKGTRKLTARSQLRLTERSYSEGQLAEALALHINAWQAVADCYVGMYALAEDREHRGQSPLRPDFAKADRQTDA